MLIMTNTGNRGSVLQLSCAVTINIALPTVDERLVTILLTSGLQSMDNPEGVPVACNITTTH